MFRFCAFWRVGTFLVWLSLSITPGVFADSVTFGSGVVSFTGSLPGATSAIAQNQAALLSFTLAGSSDISIQTFGYGGGTNAVGQLVSGTGFIPVIELYDPLGNLIADSGLSGVAGCPPAGLDGIGVCGDISMDLGSMASAGNYTLAVLAFGNAPAGFTLADGFIGIGSFDGNDGTRSNFYAVDVTGDIAAPVADTPEPGSLVLLVSGFSALVLRRRAWRRRSLQ
jgi:hypothetical protein